MVRAPPRRIGMAKLTRLLRLLSTCTTEAASNKCQPLRLDWDTFQKGLIQRFGVDMQPEPAPPKIELNRSEFEP